MSPLVLLLGSLAYSLAFNVAWAWGSSPLSVGAAAACTLIVPAGLHLWTQVPANTPFVRVLRAMVMTGICAAASITSFQHAVAVLLENQWTELAAWSVTGGAELLTALSTMALRAPAKQPAVQKKAAAKPVEKPKAKKVEKPTLPPVELEPAEQSSKVHNLNDPKPWSARAQELIEQDVPRATAYRWARKEFESVGG